MTTTTTKPKTANAIAKECGTTEGGLRFLAAIPKTPHGRKIAGRQDSSVARSLYGKELVRWVNEPGRGYGYALSALGEGALAKARELGWTG